MGENGVTFVGSCPLAAPGRRAMPVTWPLWPSNVKTESPPAATDTTSTTEPQPGSARNIVSQRTHDFYSLRETHEMGIRPGFEIQSKDGVLGVLPASSSLPSCE